MSDAVAIAIQRFGAEVTGGAEELAAKAARALREDFDVSVLTTCALDYTSWADYFPPGEERIDGVTVRRFSVPHPRDVEAFDAFSPRAYADPTNLQTGREWMALQGPNAPGLLEHLRDRKDRYRAIIFVTYLYATTAEGIAVAPERSILQPTLHDEPPARLAIFDSVFNAARRVLFNTPEERELARSRFGVDDDRARLLGGVLDPPPESDPDRFRAEFGVEGRYALCVGRVDEAKGTPQLVEMHAEYVQRVAEPVSLVVMGPGDTPLPDRSWLVRTGRASEQHKHDALKGADVVVLPSPYESLSYSQLEAWSHGRPTLANAASPVLEGQSRRASGGLWYRDAEEYAVMLDLLARSPVLGEAIGRQGQRWVDAECSWEHWRKVWLDAIAEVSADAWLPKD